MVISLSLSEEFQLLIFFKAFFVGFPVAFNEIQAQPCLEIAIDIAREEYFLGICDAKQCGEH
jgi:hypothetical protein